MRNRRRKEVKTFLDQTKFLLFAGLFFTMGLFLLLSYFVADVDTSVDEGMVLVRYANPVLFPIENLNIGDEIYIELDSDDYVDVIVDTKDNCINYKYHHDDFDPFLLGPESYKAQHVLDVTLKTKANHSEMGVIFQKTPKTGFDKTEINFKIVYPDHYTGNFCLIVGVMFVISGLAMAVIHFYRTRKSRRFEPIEREVTLEEAWSQPVEETTDEEVPKKSGASKIHHSSEQSSEKKGKKGKTGKKKK
jgi:hypothetical protein